MKPGRAYAAVWYYAAPWGADEAAFAGDRQFVRGKGVLYGIGGATPATPYAPAIVPLKAAAVPDGAPVQTFVNDVTPNAWIVAGPFKGRDPARDYLAGLGGRAAAMPKAGDAAKLDGEAATFCPLGNADFWTEPRFTNGMQSIDLMVALGKQVESSGVFCTVIENDAPRYVQFRLLTPDGIGWNYRQRLDAQAWLAGQALDEKTVYKLEKGRYVLLIQGSIGQVESWGHIWMAPRLVDVTAATETKLADHARLTAGWDAYQASLVQRFVLGP